MPLPENNIILSLSDISVSYDRTPVLQHCSINVAKDDFVLVTGPNGCGKTTLLRVMLQLLKPESGTVTYYDNGKKVERLHVGYLPQKNAIDSRFPISVSEVVESGLFDKKGVLTRSQQRDCFNTVIAELGLEPLKNRPISDLSGGELQRVLLGRAVVSQPQLLVLDEPLSYIDGAWSERIYKLLARWKSEMAVVMVTHYPERVADLATQSFSIERAI